MNNVIVCALYCDKDIKYLGTFIESHSNFPLRLCYVGHNTVTTSRRETHKDVLFFEQNLSKFDFATAKNNFLDMLKNKGLLFDNDIVIFLDIDEEIAGNPKYINETIELMKRYDSIGGVKVRIASFYAYNPNFDEPDIGITDSIKIFRGKYRFDGKVHEQIIFDIFEDKREVIPSRILLHHYGYDNAEYNAEKIYRNLRLLCSNIVEGFEDNPIGYAKKRDTLTYLAKTVEDLKNMGVI